MHGYVEVRTLYIQAEHEVLRSDDGLEHAKILVGRLAFDRCLVETAEGIHDALLALALWVFWLERIGSRDLDCGILEEELS